TARRVIAQSHPCECLSRASTPAATRSSFAPGYGFTAIKSGLQEIGTVPRPLWLLADAPFELVTRNVGLPPASGPKPVSVNVTLSAPAPMLATVMLWPTLSAGPEIRE